MCMNQTLQEASSAGTVPTDVLRTPALQKQSLADIALFLTFCIHTSHSQAISSQWRILNPFALPERWIWDGLDSLAFLLSRV